MTVSASWERKYSGRTQEHLSAFHHWLHVKSKASQKIIPHKILFCLCCRWYLVLPLILSDSQLNSECPRFCTLILVGLLLLLSFTSVLDVCKVMVSPVPLTQPYLARNAETLSQMASLLRASNAEYDMYAETVLFPICHQCCTQLNDIPKENCSLAISTEKLFLLILTLLIINQLS
jgi:hypothetical protein